MLCYALHTNTTIITKTTTHTENTNLKNKHHFSHQSHLHHHTHTSLVLPQHPQEDPRRHVRSSSLHRLEEIRQRWLPTVDETWQRDCDSCQPRRNPIPGNVSVFSSLSISLSVYRSIYLSNSLKLSFSRSWWSRWTLEPVVATWWLSTTLKSRRVTLHPFLSRRFTYKWCVKGDHRYRYSGVVR